MPEGNIIVFDKYVKLMIDEIYFDIMDRVKLNKGTFIDVGCFDGSDSVKALKKLEGYVTDVIALEPDGDNFEQCKRNLAAYNNITLINKGAADGSGTLLFEEGGGVASRFSDEGTVKVDVDTIDNIARDLNVSFIKMDVEGYEESALKGAAETIRRWKPILAVSIYHKKTDIWRLPLKILEINPNYKFMLRHYTFGWADTVLYAIDESNM